MNQDDIILFCVWVVSWFGESFGLAGTLDSQMLLGCAAIVLLLRDDAE